MEVGQGFPKLRQAVLDRSQDPEEPLRIYADPDGHPFCIFVATPPAG